MTNKPAASIDRPVPLEPNSETAPETGWITVVRKPRCREGLTAEIKVVWSVCGHFCVQGRFTGTSTDNKAPLSCWTAVKLDLYF